MKAVICTKYGLPEVLQMKEVAKPIPKDNEVLVKIHATTVTASDCIIRGFKLPITMWIPARLSLGLTKPRKAILGLVLSGEIERIGDKVTQFNIGDKVFAHTLFRFGTYAEYTCVPDFRAKFTSNPNAFLDDIDHLIVGAPVYSGKLPIQVIECFTSVY